MINVRWELRKKKEAHTEELYLNTNFGVQIVNPNPDVVLMIFNRSADPSTDIGIKSGPNRRVGTNCGVDDSPDIEAQ